MKHKLTAKAVQAAKAPKLYGDGGGLYLRVTKSGTKSWVFRWRDRATGKLRDMGLGPVMDTSLAEGRELAEVARKRVAAGLDPIKEREREKAEQRAAVEGVQTFARCAERFIASKVAPESKSMKHVAQWTSSLQTYANPHIGNMDVADIDVEDIMRVLIPIWATKSETASRVRLRMENVLSWAAVQGYRERFNPAMWRGNLSHLLPAKARIAPTKHYQSLHYDEVPGFLRDLRKKGGWGSRALEFAVLAAARSGEVRGAVWSEFDMNKRLWVIPGDRMKAGREHKVPLSEPAVALLEALPKSDNPLVFPAKRGGPLSDMTLNKICRDMQVGAVPHGFRASFKDWARECTSFPDEISELALAHINSDATRAAYARSDLLALRRDLLEQWADFCCPAD